MSDLEKCNTKEPKSEEKDLAKKLKQFAEKQCADIKRFVKIQWPKLIDFAEINGKKILKFVMANKNNLLYHRYRKKYLDDIGVKDRPDLWCPSDSRQRKWARERKIYGFDSRETWCMDNLFYQWLYEHLRMYVDVCNCMLDDPDMTWEYKGEQLTQKQIIDMLLERLEYVFKFDLVFYVPEEKREYVDEIPVLWGMVMGAMWW